MKLIKETLIRILVILILIASHNAMADDFVNGDFETGDLTGWIQGKGQWGWYPGAAGVYGPGGTQPNPADYLPGGQYYNNNVVTSNAVVSAGLDPVLAAAGKSLNTVYAGNYSVRVNDNNNNFSVSVISQTVTNYTATSINFAWSAVLLAGGHPPGDSSGFTILVKDNTTSTVLSTTSYNAATAGVYNAISNPTGLFKQVGSILYSDWQTISLTVASGHSYTVTLLAADCDAGGHWGYVYLDAFGQVAPVRTTVDATVPDIVSAGNHTTGTNINLASTIVSGASANFNNRFDGGTLFVDVAGSYGGNFSITSNGAIIDQNGLASTFTGVFSNDSTTGNLRITNSASGGSITLSGVNTYTGTTTIDSGAKLALTGAGSISLSSGVTSNGAFDISGTTSGTSITTLNGSGSVLLGSKTLEITNGASNGAGSGNFSGVISGSGGLNISGGVEALSGVNTYTGSTSINSGATLALTGDGSIASSSALNNTNGAFNITGANGNVNLGGTYTQASTGNLLMNISPINNQKVIVAGAATLAGGLNLAATAGTYTAGRYTLLTANGLSCVFGGFTTNLSDYTRLGYQLGYDANNAYLYLTPNVSDTQAALQISASALQGAFTLQNSVLVNGFTYDCRVFDKHGVCVSVGGRNTTVQAQGINNTSGLLIASYQLDEEYSRVGAYIDQNLSMSGPGTVKMNNSTPMIGIFGVWAEKLDTTGWEGRLGAAYGQKSTTVTRQVVNTSEPGTGSANLNTQGVQASIRYGFSIADDVIVYPYAGIRYTQNNMGGYTEASSATVTSPLTYSALNTNATTALAGGEVKYKFDPKTAIFASAGVETDTNTKNGTYAATGFGLTTLTPINFNPNPVKTRPTASLGGYYDVEKNQRIGITGIWRQEPFQAVSTTTVIATYTVGL